MKLTRSTGYALAGLYYIARHGRYQPVAAKGIAGHYGMPLDYLLKVLKQLAGAGILLSIRGPQGGYKLAREAQVITVKEVVEAVEGKMKAETGKFPGGLEADFVQRVHKVYQQASAQTAEVLGAVSLAELLGNQEGEEERG
jgi:Rrf2 family iron-sulfur cluster assembly transcriptional regulator